jgi:methionine aminopeptidase
VNEVICHGIPNMRPLEDGDIVNVDVTVWLNGYHGDTSRYAFFIHVQVYHFQVYVFVSCLFRLVWLCDPAG